MTLPHDGDSAGSTSCRSRALTHTHPMPLSTELTDDLVNDLIALIPEDGSRLSNDEIRAA